MMGLSIKEIALEKRNTAMGFFQAVYGIGMSTGPIVMGYMVDVNAGLFLGPFIVISLVCVSGAFAAIFLLKERTANSK
jgi:MFS family permease